MSKYEPLWIWIKDNIVNEDNFNLNFNKIKDILGFNIDHSFLTYKKELLDYGYKIIKIDMKKKSVEIGTTSSNK